MNSGQIARLNREGFKDLQQLSELINAFEVVGKYLYPKNRNSSYSSFAAAKEAHELYSAFYQKLDCFKEIEKEVSQIKE